MVQENLEKIFQDLKHYTGHALYVIMLSQKSNEVKLSKSLKKLGWKNMDIKLISQIRIGKREVSFQELFLITRACDISVVALLKIMLFYKNHENMTQEELIKELYTESKYHIWKKKQNK